MTEGLDFRLYLQAAVDRAGGQGAFAKVAGVTQPYVSDVLKGRRPPSEKLLAAVGLRKIVRYEPASLEAEEVVAEWLRERGRDEDLQRFTESAVWIAGNGRVRS